MSSEKTTRRDRVIMALGICALLLFVANIGTMIKRHFFDKHQAEQHVVVHELRRAPRAHVIAVPRIQHTVRLRTHETLARAEALIALKSRLLEEAERLGQEAEQLADAGHSDASLSLRETVEATMVKLRDLEAELEQLHEAKHELQRAQYRIQSIETAPEAVDVQIHVIESTGVNQ